MMEQCNANNSRISQKSVDMSFLKLVDNEFEAAQTPPSDCHEVGIPNTERANLNRYNFELHHTKKSIGDITHLFYQYICELGPIWTQCSGSARSHPPFLPQDG